MLQFRPRKLQSRKRLQSYLWLEFLISHVWVNYDLHYNARIYIHMHFSTLFTYNLYYEASEGTRLLDIARPRHTLNRWQNFQRLICRRGSIESVNLQLAITHHPGSSTRWNFRLRLGIFRDAKFRLRTSFRLNYVVLFNE